MPVEIRPLFRPDAIRPLLTAFQLPPRVETCRAKLNHWRELLESDRADRLNERELLPEFLSDIFGELLGYTGPASGGGHYTMSREAHVAVDGKYADAVLGDFSPDRKRFVIAVEGKSSRDPLDRPFAGRKKSAVDQALGYAVNLRCDWYIVTSMRQTRLYHKGSDQSTFELFRTADLATDEHQLRRFVFLLGAERVIGPADHCHLPDLLKSSEKIGKELTKEFYFRYAEMRQNAFEHLCSENSEKPRNDLLSATQKLLDRILFCAFCEDRGLLPADTIQRAYEHRDPYHPKPIWDNFRGLFRAIDTGNAGLDIPAYNGGLFALDPVLDNLKLTDAVCGYFRELSDFDYRPASAIAIEDQTRGQLVDVDILGHIFEQSITDLERIRNELEGRVEPTPREKLKTRRKKEGAFYTPAFITRYIVEQALGSVFRERFERLRREHETAAKAAARSALADPTVYELDKLKKPQRDALIKFWEAWQDDLKTIRVLDPACGSGAFLIEAFDQLHAVYEASNDRLAELRGTRTLFDPDREILQHNLYGVDLNDEAIEICRLSLWIKTAARGKVLTSLDHTIRVGNSVVSDPAVHPKAFDWQAAFPEVFAAGGFDVVIGNPPYIRSEWIAPYKTHWKEQFRSFDGTADIFTYFFEVGVNLLRTGGRLGFITSGSWVRGNFGVSLREFITTNAAVESMVDFGEYQPFEDAEMIRPTIAILKKQTGRGPMRIFKWLTTGSPPENLSDVIASAPTMNTHHLSSKAWELDPDDVLALRQKLTGEGISLKEWAKGEILYGIKSGLNEVFIVDDATRSAIQKRDPNSAQLFRPFVQGTHMRPWYLEHSGQHLIALKSTMNFQWPWSNPGEDAEAIFRETFPGVHEYLIDYRDAAMKRSDQGQFWWELRSCAYWDSFDQPKIVWPDITNRPRFSMDHARHCIGDSCFMVPKEDFYLLGVLSSWTTWFFISKTAQPLRLRSDRWQYRLKAQYLEHIPIPHASKTDREAVAALAKRCSSLAPERYELETQFQRRLMQTFGHGPQGEPLGKLNEKAQDWWLLSLNELGDALKTSFKLTANPLKTPRIADEWEPYLAEKRAAVELLTRQIADAEAELNDRVFQLFHLTPDEIRLLQREVEH